MSLIKDQKKIRVVNDFNGLQFGTIYPTDIDGMIDFGNKAFVFIETKYLGGHMPYGQRLAIERLSDIIEETGRQCIALVAEYEHLNGNGAIDTSKAIVTEYRMHRRWREPRNPLNVRDAIERFLEYIEKGAL